MGSTYEFGAQNAPQPLKAALYCSLVNSFYFPFGLALTHIPILDRNLFMRLRFLLAFKA